MQVGIILLSFLMVLPTFQVLQLTDASLIPIASPKKVQIIFESPSFHMIHQIVVSISLQTLEWMPLKPPCCVPCRSSYVSLSAIYLL